LKNPADAKVMSPYTPVGGGIASIGSTIGPAIADTKVMSPYTPVGGGIASIGSTIGRTMPMMYPSTCMLPAHATHSTMMNTCSGLQPPALPMKPPSLAQAYSMSILNSGLLSSPLRLPLPPPPPILMHAGPTAMAIHAGSQGMKSSRPMKHRMKQRRAGWHDRRSSRYIGVGWVVKDQKWESKIRLNGKKTYLGYFADEVDAAKKYDEHAALDGRPVNFPKDGQKQGIKRKKVAVKSPKRTSRFVGVAYNRSLQKWKAQIDIGGLRKHVGYFNCEVEAARNYDALAAEQNRPVNFPTGNQKQAMKPVVSPSECCYWNSTYVVPIRHL
jgi:hypothetical protein